jgi:Transcriptional repressor TCF25
LNKVFCDCLVKYIDILGRKGCSRTSLEYCKFLLSTNPYNDPYGALLRIDFYALRAHEYQLFLDFVRKLPVELHPDIFSSSLLILPNILISVGLAKHQSLYEKDISRLPTAQSIENSIKTVLNLEGHLNRLLDSPDPETFLIAALLLYPY